MYMTKDQDKCLNSDYGCLLNLQPRSVVRVSPRHLKLAGAKAIQMHWLFTPSGGFQIFLRASCKTPRCDHWDASISVIASCGHKRWRLATASVKNCIIHLFNVDPTNLIFLVTYEFIGYKLFFWFTIYLDLFFADDIAWDTLRAELADFK